MAFTRSCSQIFPAMPGRNGSIMKPYRYYACFPPFQAQLFTDQNTTRQSDAHFQARLQDIEGQIRRDQEQLYAVFKNSKTIENIWNFSNYHYIFQAQQKVAVAENKLEKVRSVKQKFTINESDLKRRKDNLQNMEEELLRLSLSGTLIDNFVSIQSLYHFLVNFECYWTTYSGTSLGSKIRTETPFSFLFLFRTMSWYYICGKPLASRISIVPISILMYLVSGGYTYLTFECYWTTVKIYWAIKV